MLGINDAAHCSNGLTARKFRTATAEESAIYRRWMRGVLVFYGTLLLISAAVAIVGYSKTGLTKLATYLGH